MKMDLEQRTQALRQPADLVINVDSLGLSGLPAEANELAKREESIYTASYVFCGLSWSLTNKSGKRSENVRKSPIDIKHLFRMLAI